MISKLSDEKELKDKIYNHKSYVGILFLNKIKGGNKM